MKNKYELFGKYVKISAYMKPAKKFQAREHLRRELKEPRMGMVVGYRTVYDGRIKRSINSYSPEEYDPPHFIVGKTIKVLLVCFWPTYKPVLVLPEDILMINMQGWRTKITDYLHPTTHPISDTDRGYLREYAKEMKRDVKGRWIKG